MGLKAYLCVGNVLDTHDAYPKKMIHCFEFNHKDHHLSDN